MISGTIVLKRGLLDQESEDMQTWSEKVSIMPCSSTWGTLTIANTAINDNAKQGELLRDNVSFRN